MEGALKELARNLNAFTNETGELEGTLSELAQNLEEVKKTFTDEIEKLEGNLNKLAQSLNDFTDETGKLKQSMKQLVRMVEATERISRDQTREFFVSIFFPRARTNNQEENCQLDQSPGKGIGLLVAQENQLKELVDLVATINEKREIVIHVKGFASRLSFVGLSNEESNNCNLKAAKLRGKKVCEYLKKELRDLGVPVKVKAESWGGMYEAMNQNRPFPYEQEVAGKLSPGIHALNQLVHIAISSP